MVVRLVFLTHFQLVLVAALCELHQMGRELYLGAQIRLRLFSSASLLLRIALGGLIER